MPIDAQGVDLGRWLLAVLPVAALIGLVLWDRWSTVAQAAVAVAAATAIGATAFGAGAQVLAVAAGKGLWTGVWILYVIGPALLLYRITATVGIDRLGGALGGWVADDVERVLLLAWVLPGFVQGVAGFGAPIAVTAPLLVATGLDPVRAVALPLVGYHWSVTFGSMGSSFYMGALTAGLDSAQTAAYAADSALLLGVNVLASGAAVALLHGGVDALRRGAPMLVTVGAPIVVGLQVAVRIEPAVGSLTAGACGLVAVGIRRRVRTARGGRARDVAAADPSSQMLTVVAPYAYLLVTVLAVLVPAGSRRFATAHLRLGPAFPATETALGVRNPGVDLHTPIALLAHPGTYLLVATALGLVTYRIAGNWPSGALGPAVRRWSGAFARSAGPILALTTLAAVLVDTGMVRTIAAGLAGVTGEWFPAVSPSIGAVGSFATGSTTTSNALFAALQRDVAVLVDVPPAILVAAQTAGGNVGNLVAPVLIVVGASAVDARDRVGRVFRTTIAPTAVFLVLTTAVTLALVAAAA